MKLVSYNLGNYPYNLGNLGIKIPFYMLSKTHISHVPRRFNQFQ